ncbi:MAG: beta-galactosidase [Kiritimatiellae bacterium]|nr:beta-galactosidase [Kiritimatiellia bacterium]
MITKKLFIGFVLLASALTTSADWSLYEQFDRVLVYDGQFLREYTYKPRDIRGPHSGLLIWAALPQKDGKLKPYGKGMEVKGELRSNQLLLSGESTINPTVVEFVVIGGSKLDLEFGLCDLALEKGSKGTLLKIEMLVGGKSSTETVTIGENRWEKKTVVLPKAERVLVRLMASRRGGGTNWTGLVVRGDGEIGSRDQARALSPNCDRIGKLDVTLKPSPNRVTIKSGYDILFYRDKPFLSFATKGNPAGSEEMQGKLGFNTFYVEGMGFMPYWPEGTPGVVIPPNSSIHHDLRLSQQFDMPFKATISMAHCSPFLPKWLVKKENLGLEGHKLRRGGDTHTSFIKPATLRWHKTGLEGWVKPFLDQPTLFVFGQEDDASLWDDYSADAVANWRAWLKKRFGGDFRTFGNYVGGVRGVDGFDGIPQPKRFEPDERFGFPMRLAYLKLQWITESYGDYLAELFVHMRKLVPGVPLTQRFVNWAGAPTICKRVGFDYNYTFGHLTSEGVPNSYGIGKKIWTGIYAHMGTLPLPRGGSIGKTYSPKIRRGAMTRAEWELNAFTIIANGGCGFEYSTLVPTWGPEWEQSALYDADGKLTPTGEAGAPVIKEALENARYMMHYEQYPDVAVFHDASFNSGPFGGRWGHSKVGIYTLIRETGFHFDPLSEGDMTAEKLRGRKVLVLAGSLSLAPEVQAAIRDYVRGGGTLVTAFCSDGQGFPGCNSYDYACKVRESAAQKSFDEPKAAAHLGDVLGIRAGSGVTVHEQVKYDRHGTISLKDFNTLAKEGRWVKQDACCANLSPRPEAKVLATFEDNSPAAIEHRFGNGRAITFAFDIGLIANNLTIPPLYAWWSDTLVPLGCRKVVDTGNWFVEAGAWHDDAGNRLIILVNHDAVNAQDAKLPDGKTVRLDPGRAKTVVCSKNQ